MFPDQVPYSEEWQDLQDARNSHRLTPIVDDDFITEEDLIFWRV
jgi:hypothetical protein